MEAACSSVYHLLALNFPEENDLWMRLAIAEESHAAAVAKGIHLKGPEELIDFAVPRDLELVRKTVDYAKEMKKLLINNKLSFDAALEGARRIQELKNDSYVHDLLEKETDERVKKVFRRLSEIDRANLDIISTVVAKYEARNSEK